MRDTLIGLRPKDDTAAAIRAALAAIAREIDSADARRLAAIDNRKTALRDPKATTKDVVAFEVLTNEAAIEIERLGALRATLEARLGQVAKAEREDRLRADLERNRKNLAEAAARLRAKFPDYLDAGSVIAETVELEHQVDAARAALVGSINALIPLGTVGPRECFDLGVETPDTTFARDCRLPGLPGGSFLVGSPPAHPIAPHPYQNEPRRWGG